MQTIFNRLREPSTWAGIAALATMAGVPANTMGLIQQTVIGVAGLVAVLVPEVSGK
jgi:hypothetical protein